MIADLLRRFGFCSRHWTWTLVGDCWRCVREAKAVALVRKMHGDGAA